MTVDTASSGAVIDNVLNRLPGMLQRANGSLLGFCPAHDDHNRSLSFKVGYKGLLIKCWAGCTLDDICRAIDLEPSALFFDAPQSQAYKKNGTKYQKANLHYRWPWRRQVGEILVITGTRAALAEDFLGRVKSLDPETLTDFQKDFLLEKISLAWSWINAAESAADLCYSIAHRMREKEVPRG